MPQRHPRAHFVEDHAEHENAGPAFACAMTWYFKHLATVGSVDERVLAEARQARDRLVRAEQDAEGARAEVRRAVHRLVERGSSLRDISAALGFSDQQLDEVLQAARRSGGARGGGVSDTGLACTFCERPQGEIGKLIAGPAGLFICDACVQVAEGVISSGSAAGTPLGLMHAVPGQDRRAPCSFCGKVRDQVPGMAAVLVELGGKVSWPVAICLECLSLCDEIMAEELT